MDLASQYTLWRILQVKICRELEKVYSYQDSLLEERKIDEPCWAEIDMVLFPENEGILKETEVYSRAISYSGDMFRPDNDYMASFWIMCEVRADYEVDVRIHLILDDKNNLVFVVKKALGCVSSKFKEGDIIPIEKHSELFLQISKLKEDFFRVLK